MALRVWEFPEPREVPMIRDFPKLKLFPPVSHEMEVSREFPTHGFLLNIPATFKMQLKNT